MNQKTITIIFTMLLLFAFSGITHAITFDEWNSMTFLDSSRSEINNKLGKADDADNEMDLYLISDSPKLMLMGMLRYNNGKVNAVMEVCQPTVSYGEVRALQSTNSDLKKLFEDSRGCLFEHQTPQPNRAKFIMISPPDDNTAGPILTLSIEKPFQESEKAISEKSTPAPSIANKVKQGEILKACGKEWWVGEKEKAWQDAKDKVASLGGNWRMPTSDELHNLFLEVGQTSPIGNCEAWADDNNPSSWRVNFSTGYSTEAAPEHWSFNSHAVAVRP